LTPDRPTGTVVATFPGNPAAFAKETERVTACVGSRQASSTSSPDEASISLAYLPSTPRRTRAAFIGAAALVVGLAVLWPFAAKPMPMVSGFIAALDAVISVTDLITAGLLLAHFSIARSKALWALACGYLFSALIVVAHGLTFPGIVSATGNLFGGSHTNFRIYLLWHLGLPVALVAYSWLRDNPRPAAAKPAALEVVLTVCIAVTLALASCFACLVLVPPLDPSAGTWLTLGTIAICAVALSALWVSQRSALDQWLMVVVLAMIVELTLTALIGHSTAHAGAPPGVRSVTVGFYTGRLFSLVTSSVVLTALLAETTQIYARIADANTLTKVAKAAQTLSSEIESSNLIEQLMRLVLEHAGAERGLLVLFPAGEPFIEAEATAKRGNVEVQVLHATITDADLPESALREVMRTREPLVLESALLLPIVKRAKLTGVLYLENHSSPHVFMAGRLAMLNILASQAAISLENASLYAELQLQAGLLQRLPVSAWTLDPDGTPDFVNQVWLDYSGQTLDFVRSHPEAWITAVHPEEREAAASALWAGVRSGRGFSIEARSLRARDESYRWHLQQAVVLRDAAGQVLKFVGTTTDIHEQKRAEDSLHQAQIELARVNRVTTMGELAASLAHEVSQPLSGIMTNANVCLRKLTSEQVELPDVRGIVTRIIRDAQRAFEIIERIRAQFRKSAPNRESLDLGETMREIIALLRGEATRYRVAIRMELSPDLPRIVGDRVQLQQVAMNLLVNSIDAMKAVEGARELVVRSLRAESNEIVVSVSDTGTGLPAQLSERIFEPFFTTKPHGMGMGLRISRAIIESHGGRLWAAANADVGTTFSFSIPCVHRAES
jgi:PAS domain S-box-containing protein